MTFVKSSPIWDLIINCVQLCGIKLRKRRIPFNLVLRASQLLHSPLMLLNSLNKTDSAVYSSAKFVGSLYVCKIRFPDFPESRAKS